MLVGQTDRQTVFTAAAFQPSCVALPRGCWWACTWTYRCAMAHLAVYTGADFLQGW